MSAKAISNDLLTVWTYDELVPDDRGVENRLAHADERDRYAERGGVFGSEAEECARYPWKPAKPPAFPTYAEIFAQLGPDETVVGSRDGRPLVRHKSGRAGTVYGAIYLIDAPGYDDREAFDPLGTGVFLAMATSIWTHIVTPADHERGHYRD